MKAIQLIFLTLLYGVLSDNRMLYELKCNTALSTLNNCVCKTSSDSCDGCQEGFYDTKCETDCSHCSFQGACEENSLCQWNSVLELCELKDKNCTAPEDCADQGDKKVCSNEGVCS